MRMRAAGLVLLPLCGLLLAGLPHAPAQAPTLHLQAVDEDGRSFFRLAGHDEENPTLFVQPGSRVSITLSNAGERNHNLQLGSPLSTGTPCCQRPGEESTLTFEVPANATGEIPYFCVLHREAGMAGLLVVSTRTGPAPRISILSPAQDATVPPSFDMQVRVENLRLVEPGAGGGPGDGHLHHLLDGKEAPGAWDTAATSFRFEGLTPGHHELTVELVRPDHQPFEPRVHASVLVFVSEALAPPPETTPPTPPASDRETPGPGAWAVAAGLALALLAPPSRRGDARQRTGSKGVVSPAPRERARRDS